jgi:hypothetical protein
MSKPNQTAMSLRNQKNIILEIQKSDTKTHHNENPEGTKLVPDAFTVIHQLTQVSWCGSH